MPGRRHFPIAPTPVLSGYLTPAEAAARLRLPVAVVADLIDSGRIEAMPFGQGKLITEASLRRWVEGARERLAGRGLGAEGR